MHHWKQPFNTFFYIANTFLRKQEWGRWDLLQCEKEIHGIKGTCCSIGFDRPWLSVEFASTVRSCSPGTVDRVDGRSILITYLLTHSLTHSLTPCSTVLLGRPTGLQLVKKFPAFHGTRRFLTAFTSARYLSLS